MGSGHENFSYVRVSAPHQMQLLPLKPMARKLERPIILSNNTHDLYPETQSSPRFLSPGDIRWKPRRRIRAT